MCSLAGELSTQLRLHEIEFGKQIAHVVLPPAVKLHRGRKTTEPANPLCNATWGGLFRSLAAPFDQRRQFASNTTAGNRRSRDGRQAFARDVVDNVKQAEAPTPGEMIVDEIQ